MDHREILKGEFDQVSRIGKVPISIPKGVQIALSPDGVASVKGAKGEMKIETLKNVDLRLADGRLIVERHGDEPQERAYHGLYHRLITNAIKGVTIGYNRELELQGVGYRADMQGKTLVLNVGRSHDVRFPTPAGITLTTPKNTQIIVSGIDKQAVSQAAAQIRGVCPPEPYKGKGIRYLGESVRRKVGKTGAK